MYAPSKCWKLQVSLWWQRVLGSPFQWEPVSHTRAEPLGVLGAAWCRCNSVCWAQHAASKQGMKVQCLCLTVTEFDLHFKPLFCWVIETTLQAFLGFLWCYTEWYKIAAIWSFLNTKNGTCIWCEVLFGSVTPGLCLIPGGVGGDRAEGRAAMCRGTWSAITAHSSMLLRCPHCPMPS